MMPGAVVVSWNMARPNKSRWHRPRVRVSALGECRHVWSQHVGDRRPRHGDHRQTVSKLAVRKVQLYPRRGGDPVGGVFRHRPITGLVEHRRTVTTGTVDLGPDVFGF